MLTLDTWKYYHFKDRKYINIRDLEIWMEYYHFRRYKNEWIPESVIYGFIFPFWPRKAWGKGPLSQGLELYLASYSIKSTETKVQRIRYMILFSTFGSFYFFLLLLFTLGSQKVEENHNRISNHNIFLLLLMKI